MPLLDPTWVHRAHRNQTLPWIKYWAVGRDWPCTFPEMILWHATAGLAVMQGAADNIVDRARSGKVLPEKRRVVWNAARKLTATMCNRDRINPVDWLTGRCGDIEIAWNALDDIPGIGPKIASFIMREIGFHRDYSTGVGGLSVRYRRWQRDSRWFDRLPLERQALFVPIDNRVHSGACRYAVASVFSQYSAREMHADPRLHREGANALVAWSRKRGFDPRDVDVYLYATERGFLNRDGTARKA